MSHLRSADVVLEISARSKERPRFARGHAHLSTGYRDWLENCRALMSEWWLEPPLSTVRVVCAHFFGPAQGDLDNKVGAVLDAGNGLIWVDDNVQCIPVCTTRWTKASRKEARIHLKVVWETSE